MPQEDVRGEPPVLPAMLASAGLDNTEGVPSSTNHVRLDHLFCTPDDNAYVTDDVRTLATIQRYKSKCVTTILIAAKEPQGSPRQIARAMHHHHTVLDHV